MAACSSTRWQVHRGLERRVVPTSRIANGSCGRPRRIARPDRKLVIAVDGKEVAVVGRENDSISNKSQCCRQAQIQRTSRSHILQYLLAAVRQNRQCSKL